MRPDAKRSYTAEAAAALRAATARHRKLGNPDQLAEQFVGRRYRWQARNPVARTAFLAVVEVLMPGMPAFLTARTKHLDATLLAEVRAGAVQVVVLGAGADSRAYRFGTELAGADVVELDHPATSAWKQRRVRDVLGGEPPGVRHVAVDLASRPLAEAFDEAAVRRDRRTVVLWEGVAAYLPAAAVDATLTAIAGLHPGSVVVFDYVNRAVMDRPSAETRRFLRYLDLRGEPILSALDPDQLGEYLTGHGLELVDDSGPDELRREHLPSYTGRFPRSFGIVRARVR